MGHNDTSEQLLENLAAERNRRRLISHCLREIDKTLAERHSKLEARTANAEDKPGHVGSNSAL